MFTVIGIMFAGIGIGYLLRQQSLPWRGMFALIPALLLLVCVPLLMRYPITRESHVQVLKQLEERRKEQSK